MMENNNKEEEDKILRPDIHSQLNELLVNSPTTLFVDNLLNTTYSNTTTTTMSIAWSIFVVIT